MRKLIAIIFILSPVSAFASSIYYTYGNAPMIHGAFNAIAMMFNSSSFSSAVEAIFVMSFAVSVYMSVFNRRFEFLKYMFLSIFVLTFFFWDRTELVIEDVTLDETYLVDDVPYGYAFVGELISSFGYFVTDFTDTAFSVPTTAVLFGQNNALPSQLSYSEIGFAGPFKALKDLNSFDLKDAQIKSDLNEYASKCLIWDALGLTSVEQKQLLNNGSLVNTNIFPEGLTSRYDVPVIINGYGTTCSTYYPTNLHTRIQNHVHNVLSNLNSETKLLPYTSSLSESLAYFTNTSYSTYDAMVQSAVAKTVIKGLANGAYVNDRDAYNQFISEMGIEKYQQEGNILARFGSQVMPVFKNVMEVLMISVLPIILFFFILPNGWKLVSNYVQSLIWIQLWNPILSIINYVLAMAGLWQSKIAEEISGMSNGLTIGNIGYLTDFAQNYMAVAGYLMLSMPALATVVLMGGRWATGALAQGIAMSAYGAAAMGASPQGMEQIQRQGSMSEEMVKWNESGVDTIGMQMNRQRGFAQQYMQESTDALATKRLMNEFGYSGGKAMQDFFARQSTVNAAQQGMQMEQREKTFEQMGDGNMFDGMFKSAQARSMGDVANMTAELKSPQDTLNAMYGAKSTLSAYEAEAAKLGNHDLARKYNRMGDVLDSQISKYDADGDGQIDADKIQEMKNDIATFNQTRKSVEAEGFKMGAEEFDNPNSQALLMASLQASGELRRNAEISAEYSTKNYGDAIGLGSMKAAQGKANFNAAMEKWDNFNGYQKAQLSATRMQEAVRAGKIEGWDTNKDGEVSYGEGEQGIQRFAAMSTYMNKSEAQQFWDTFEDDPNKAMEALNTKYGMRYEADKQFAEIAKDRGLDPERLGRIMANEEIFQKEYTEGKNQLLQEMAKELGASEAALRGSDPKTTAIMKYAENQYDRVRSGEITQEEAANSLKMLGIGRGVATFMGGSKGDLLTMAGRSGLSLITKLHGDADSPMEKDYDIQIGKQEYQIDGRQVLEGVGSSDLGTPLLKQSTEQYLKDYDNLSIKITDSENGKIAGIDRDFVPIHEKYKLSNSE